VKPTKRNLFDDLPVVASGEDFSELLRRGDLVIERIVSSSAPESVLYDQDQDEWVLLVEGRAMLEVAGEAIDLGPGDHLFIPAHTPHRVIATIPAPRCIWLAVHLYPDAAAPTGA
jgi:cupin 2 domain-containing protein